MKKIYCTACLPLPVILLEPHPHPQDTAPPTHNNLTTREREGHWKWWALKLMFIKLTTYTTEYRMQNTEQRTQKLMYIKLPMDL